MSTQSPQPTESESIEQRALNEMLETKASRRNVLRGIGATGTAAVAGSGAIASEGTAAAQEDNDDSDSGLNVTSPTLAKYGMVADVSQSLTDRLFGSDGEELPEDEIELHGEATYQLEGIENYYVTVDNHLEDTLGVATLDARHAIASAWEDGKDSATAYSDAMDAIREYYALHEENHLKVLQNEMLQLSVLGEKVAQNNDIRSMFIHATAEPVEAGTGTDYDTMLIREAESANEHTFTLENGDEINLEMPEMQCRVHDDDSTKDPEIGTTDRYPIDQELLNSWEDVEPQDYLVWEDSDGNQYDSVMDFVLLDIDDPANEGETLRESAILFSMRQWMGRYQEIKDQSDSATGRFSQNMVDEMFQMMDDGTLDSSEVRSAEGMRRYLSGDSDVSSDSYKLALYNQLDLGQADLSELAHMQIEYTGYTDQEVTYDGQERALQPSGFVEDRLLAGMLYTHETPDSGLQTGDTYRIGGQTIYLGMTDSFSSLDMSTGETTPHFEGLIYGPVISNDGQTAYFARRGDNNTICVSMSLRDYSENWRVQLTDGDGVNMVHYNDDLEEVYCIDALGELSVLDSQSGTVKETHTADGNGTNYVTDEDENLYWVDGGTDVTFEMFDIESREVKEIDLNVNNVNFGINSSGSIHYENDQGTVAATEIESGEQLWSVEYPDLNVLTISKDYENIFLCDSSETEIVCLNPENGEERWSVSHSDIPGGGVYQIRQFTSSESIYLRNSDSDAIVVLESDGSLQNIVQIDSDESIRDFGVDLGENVDAELPRSMFYDATESEELDLQQGVFTIEKMLDSNGESIEEEQSWDASPEYETIDNEQFVEYVEKQTELIDTIENGGEDTDEDQDVNITWPDFPDFGLGDQFGGDGTGSLLGLALIALVVISVAWSVLTEFIPFLGK
ncbi:PQQ-binding-like beta-propeller repeat protein [Halostagnicola larsenii]|nr:PQQ-binding-like beta-propeller repeat protein [Halostagnicola larsenii]